MTWKSLRRWNHWKRAIFNELLNEEGDEIEYGDGDDDDDDDDSDDSDDSDISNPK